MNRFKSINESLNQPIDDRIIFEDDALLVLNKPVGLVVQGAESKDVSLIQKCKEYLLRKNPSDEEPYVVPQHRLDRNVTGVVIFAKNNKAGSFLQKHLKGFSKKYLALCWGTPEKKSGIWQHWHVKERKKARLSDWDPDHPPEDKETPAAEVLSDYKVLKKFPKRNGLKLGASLIEIKLRTGKYHQIRAQCAYEGNFLFGDVKYAPKPLCQEFPRPALHSYEMEIKHPDGRSFQLAAPIPEDFQKLQEMLEDGTLEIKL